MSFNSSQFSNEGTVTPNQTPGELNDVFTDLEIRFLNSLPPSELKPERLFFHLEQAWWLYEDELSDKHRHLPHFKFEDFSREFFKRSGRLESFRGQFDQMYAAFKDYQHRIPVYGGALLTADLQKVLLVTGFRSQNSWGFPKGKINQGEDELACALREVYEETGFDAAYLNPKKEDKLVWSQKNGKTIKIFIIPGVPEDFAFAPRVVKEIDEIRWWKINDLPKPEKSKSLIADATANPAVAEAMKANKNKFWGVSAFTTQLRRWIARKQNKPLPPGEDLSGEEAGDTEEDDLAGALGHAKGEFSVEEMFRVNKILREKELAAGQQAQASPATGKTPQAKTKKEKIQTKQESRQAKQQPLQQVTAIAKKTSKPTITPAILESATTKGDGFSVDFSRVSKAMQPFLNC